VSFAFSLVTVWLGRKSVCLSELLSGISSNFQVSIFVVSTLKALAEKKIRRTLAKTQLAVSFGICLMTIWKMAGLSEPPSEISLNFQESILFITPLKVLTQKKLRRTVDNVSLQWVLLQKINTPIPKADWVNACAIVSLFFSKLDRNEETIHGFSEDQLRTKT
jgi:hypothetical protein